MNRELCFVLMLIVIDQLPNVLQIALEQFFNLLILCHLLLAV